ncbi:LAQU0S18e00562g1_1 [Lachancea quebecensis]|uniref:LAQU0S18e00562g1_1 n=1 Tax=Lachancea quebecensis TaxID=1654605 RepID=A0A0P1KWU9_9SACH|nr:LAQU0S18e00562g1_1 [Lachancea quebecensis]
MSESHHDNAFQERKRKLSIWVKRIIQPNREQAHAQQRQRTQRQERRRPQQFAAVSPKPHSKRRSVKSGIASAELTTPLAKREPPARCVAWETPVYKEAAPHLPRLDFDHAQDNASTAPLVSHCSSSVKSSVFSDVTSLQSTRATVSSSKTFDTNASTVGIPSASILDRARHTNPAQGAPSVFSAATTQHTS